MSPPKFKISSIQKSNCIVPSAVPSSTGDSPNPSSSFHPDFLPLLHHLAQPLRPLVHCTSGEQAPNWPKDILNFHLLSEPQLDSLALFFGQIWPPVAETTCYPRRLDTWIGTANPSEINLDTRRRRFGYFIGLYESESEVTDLQDHSSYDDVQDFGTFKYPKQLGDLNDWNHSDSKCAEAHCEKLNDLESIRENLDCIEREWQVALDRARCEQRGRFLWK